MKVTVGKRIWSIVLVICLIISLMPVFVSEVEVEANALSVSSLTCSAYISNATARSYIDTMMKYYINNNSTLQSTLTSGKCVIFMFEGGSDNYWTGSDYYNGLSDVRIQAACFVVKLDSSGNAYIAFCSETCSSIPSYAPDCTAGQGYSGSTTILDGIYRAYRWNHTGPYAAFQLDVNNSNANGYGLYVPSSVPDGQLLGCSGINLHSRSTTSWSNWSAGCQLIGTGADSSNEFNAFFKCVSGLNFNPWVYYSSSLYSYDYYGYGWGSGYTVGYYVVDRQLGMIGVDGTKYGTGSLNEIYNTTALGKLTSYSTSAANAAGALNFDYITSSCTYYPAHCQIKVTSDEAIINSQPCSVGTGGSETLEEPAVGTTYTATALYKNGYGNYWYRVTTSGGETGYIYGGEATYVKQLTSDITLTDYDTPNGHVAGNVFDVTGTIASKYNKLNTADVWVHSGFGTSGSQVTGYSDTVSNNKYVLDSSTIDYNTAFNEVSTGNYTYAISANYTNYYAEGATTLKSNTGTIYLCEEYFVVVSSSVDQSSCSHTYTTTTLGSGSCTDTVTVVKSCSKCGLVTESTSTGSHSYGSWIVSKAATCTEAGSRYRTCSKCSYTQTETIAATGSHSYGDWTVTQNATCTASGSMQRTCSVCSNVETQSIAATGHNYTAKEQDATCQDYAKTEYTCGSCGDYYVTIHDEMANVWYETKPEEVDDSLIETKTQYRYSDYETVTSYSAALDGYTQIDKEWETSSSGYTHYVSSWPSGFDTSHSLYTKYNNSPRSASETTTSKTVVGSSKIIGYIYYHWCRNSYTEGPINRTTTATQDSTHTTFHAFAANISTIDPSTLPTDTSDGSVTYAYASCCTDSWWYFLVPVYEQTYTTYKALFTYERWTDYSDWSDTVYTASDTRKVETRTLYRQINAGLGDHVWDEGVATTPAGCLSEGIMTYTCTACGVTRTETIDATGHSYETSVTSPTCTEQGYTTCTCASCGDSYETDQVSANGHSWSEDVCSVCNLVCEHDYVNKVCTICGMDKPVVYYYLFGYINGENYACDENYAELGTYKFDEGTLVTSFVKDSYIGVKAEDNSNWYYTDGYLGETTEATLYNINDLTGDADLLFVPGGYEITFTLIENEDGTLSISYSVGAVVEPEYFTLIGATLTLESEVKYNIYFSYQYLDVPLTDIGVITFKSEPSTPTVENADYVMPGVGYDERLGMNFVQTQGVPAKEMRDALYYRLYAKLDDGSYVYGDLRSYSAKTYAYNMVNRDTTSVNLKNVLVALMNFGAAAQTEFGYKTDDLMNSWITADQQSGQAEYSADLLDGVVKADSAKVGTLAATDGAFTSKLAGVTLTGAMAINYFFLPGNTVDNGEMTMYYWSAEKYAGVDEMTLENADGSVKMVPNGSYYEGVYTDIAAKEIDDTVYVLAVYESEGETCMSGIVSYSIEYYCRNQVNKGADNQALCEALTIYGYAAKINFGED